MRGDALSAADTAWAMDEIMAGAATPAQLAAFAVLLRAKGETAEEISGLVHTMLARSMPVPIEGLAVDVVGTGADRAHTVNISTMAALVVAGSGRRVVKHGNRAASSACGTADVLEELGVVIDLPGEGVAATVAEVGIGFCFAPVFHSGMRHAIGPRRELGVPTAFNFLGPLTNPVRPSALAVGVADPRMGDVLAGVLASRGNSALVFHGGGLDELTTTGPSSVWVVSGGTVVATELDPLALGLPRARLEDLRGGDAPYNAEIVRSVLSGAAGPVRDIVVLNAAAANAASEGLGFVTAAGDPAAAASQSAIAEGLVKALSGGITRAAEAIDSGAARDLLARWAQASHRLAP
jgi:anthranilate phosphoribosyltransferase